VTGHADSCQLLVRGGTVLIFQTHVIAVAPSPQI
jgi:hypothetical protein